MATRKEELADQFTQEKVDGKGLNPKWPTMRQWLAASFDAYELADAFEKGWEAACKEMDL